MVGLRAMTGSAETARAPRHVCCAGCSTPIFPEPIDNLSGEVEFFLPDSVAEEGACPQEHAIPLSPRTLHLVQVSMRR